MVAALSILAALIAGGIAAIAGFGIGSVVTPVLSLEVAIGLAVAIVAIPHFVAGVIRLVPLWRAIERRVLLGFGLASAAGGLAGALLHAVLGGVVLVLVFGVLLALAGLRTLFAAPQQWRFRGWAAFVAGGLSGLLGGLVGNQGGIRSAALLNFDLSRDSFIATGTAVGIIVDVVRIPVYLATDGAGVEAHWRLLLMLIAAVAVGTVAGYRLLLRIPDTIFRRVVGGLILVLGLYMLVRGVVDAVRG